MELSRVPGVLPGVIPKIIHQTWKTSEIPEKWKSSTDKYKLLVNDGWEYRLWTDADNRQLIEQDYPWFLAKFDSYEYPIQRADAVRYFILHKFGGVYSDLDIQPKANFGAFYEMYKDADVALPSTKQGNGFGGQNFSNCFMMSKPGCDFWPVVWKHLQEPYKNTHWWKHVIKNAHYFKILHTTGPGIICDSAQEYDPKHEKIVAIPAQLVQPGVEKDTPPVTRPEAVVELLKGESWQQGDANFWRTMGDVINSATWVLLGIVIFLVLVLAFLGFQYRKQAKKVAEYERRYKTVRLT